MIRSAFLGVLLGLASLVVAVPTPVYAGERCGCPGCKCDECSKNCKCCGPVADKAAEQAGQCPGPNCPLVQPWGPVIQPAVRRPDPQPEQKEGPFRPRPTNGNFSPTKTPVSSDGLRAVADLPVTEHHRNTGGMGMRGPGSGAGLCVFTSIWHAAIWQNIPAIFGYRDWMMNKPGGGWPEKVDQTLKQYCAEKGIEVPGYVQHTGGDVSFLKHALGTGRMVCVTYAGMDDFYNGPIGHMVNLVYLDDDTACIIDNNRPGSYVWMTASAFSQRWLEQSGGWAIVFTAPPPPPYAVKPGVQEFLATPPDETEGHKRVMGNQQVVQFLQLEEAADASEVLTYDEGVKKAKETGLPLVTFIGVPAKAVHGCLVCAVKAGTAGFPQVSVLVSKWVGDRHVGVPATKTKWGAYDVDAAVAKIDPEAALKNAAVQGDQPNFGVDLSKIERVKRYSVGGKAATKRQAFAAVEGDSAVDEAGLRWNLSFVGDSTRLGTVRTLVKQLPILTREKLNVQYYTPDSWAVKQFGLKPGVNLRKPDAPKIDRVGEEVPVKGDLLDDLTLELLVKLLDQAMNPKPVVPDPPVVVPPVAPPVVPGPVVPPVNPNPAPVTPTPGPDQEPAVPADGTNLLLAFLAVLAAWFLRRKSAPPVPSQPVTK